MRLPPGLHTDLQLEAIFGVGERRNLHRHDDVVRYSISQAGGSISVRQGHAYPSTAGGIAPTLTPALRMSMSMCGCLLSAAAAARTLARSVRSIS